MIARQTSVAIVVFAAITAGAAHAQTTASAPIFTDVTDRAFSVVWVADEAATGTVRVYADAAGAEELTTSLVVAFESDAAAQANGVLRVQVAGLAAGVTVYVQTETTAIAGGEPIAEPLAPPFPPVTTRAALHRLDATGKTLTHDVLLVDVVANGGTPAQGTLVLAGIVGAAHPVSAFTGFNTVPGRALLDLNNLHSLSGAPFALAGQEPLVLRAVGGATGRAQRELPLPYPSDVARIVLNLPVLTLAPESPCNDGIDQDADGDVDFPQDIGCKDALWQDENPQCDDGADNDNDGKRDWDGVGGAYPVDPQCTDKPWANREASSCGLGAELALLLPLLLCRRRRRATRGFSVAALAASLVIGGVDAAQAREVAFAPPEALATATSGLSHAQVLDLDEDGDLDLVSASSGDDTISWWERNGDAFTQHVVSQGAVGAASVFVADVNRDGHFEVLSASQGDDKISWYMGDGGSPPSFRERPVISNLDGSSPVEDYVDGASFVLAADVDEDADLDVVVTSASNGALTWFENREGNGTVWVPHRVVLGEGNPSFVAVVDLDGDHDKDLVTALPGSGKIAWYANGGDGLSWTPGTVTTVSGGARAFTAVDLDRDGDLDLGVAAADSDEVHWYENAVGDASAWNAAAVGVAEGAAWADARDVDADGDPDLVSAATDGTVAWHENTASDASAWSTHALADIQGAAQVIAVDLDRDGDLDVMSGTAELDQIAWSENRTIHRSATFQNVNLLESNPKDLAEQVAVGDLDGDGDPDLAVAHSLNPNPVILFWENVAGDASTWVAHEIPTDFGRPQTTVILDCDLDGDLDIAATGQLSPYPLAWWENVQGDGSQWQRRIWTNLGPFPHKLIAADIDGDGADDVATAPRASEPPRWFSNPSRPGGGMIEWAEESEVIWPADIDGDGRTDLISAPEGFLSDYVGLAWYNDSHLSEMTIHEISPGTLFRSGSAGDFDGDGDEDVLSGGQGLRLWENLAGDGTTWAQRLIRPTGDHVWTHPIDLDADGDLDVVDGGLWHENVGGTPPSFTEHTAGTPLGAPSGIAKNVVPVDLDRDGDVDFVRTVGGSGTASRLVIYLNHGGQFALTTLDTSPGLAPNGSHAPLLQVVASHRGRAGDHDIAIERWTLRFEQAPGDPLTSAEANALVETLSVYLDDGDGVYEPAHDIVVQSVASLALVAGVQTVDFPAGDPATEVTQGSPRTYFVAVQLTANAATQAPNQFMVTNVTETGASAVDAETRIPLDAEYAADVTSSPLQAQP